MTDYGASQGQRLSTAAPRQIFRAWSRYRLPAAWGDWSRLAVGGGVRAQSSFYAAGTIRTWNPTGGTDGTGAWDGPNTPYSFTEPGRAVWGLFAEYRLDPRWSLTLNVNNVFDKTYFANVGTTASGNRYGEPRNVLLTLRGSF